MPLSFDDAPVVLGCAIPQADQTNSNKRRSASLKQLLRDLKNRDMKGETTDWKPLAGNRKLLNWRGDDRRENLQLSTPIFCTLCEVCLHVPGL